MSTLQFPQSLADKYRPREVSEFVGLEKPKKVLENFIEKPFASAWLFLGPSGTGKTSMALALAAMIPAELHHIPSRQCDLENVESTVHTCHYVPLAARFHLVLVDEADQMTPAAQLAFLSKTDATAAPPNTIFIFTANDTRLLEPRFLSRCHLLEFSAASTRDALPRYLAKIAKREGYHFDDLTEIAEQAGSNVRDSLMRLEVELLSGDKKGIPVRAKVSTENDHKHFCEKHSAAWHCAQADCALPFRSECKQCGGEAKTVYQLRAEKAVATRTENIRRQLRQGRAR